MLKFVAHAIDAEPDAYRHTEDQRDIELVEVVLPPLFKLGERKDCDAEEHHNKRDKHPSWDNVFHTIRFIDVLFIVAKQWEI